MKKRWALRICVFLLLGAIVNVAVAWGIEIARNMRSKSILRTPAVFVTGPTWTTVQQPLPPREEIIRIDMRLPSWAGWPCRAFEAFRYDDPGSGKKMVPTTGIWRRGVEVSSPSMTLPVRPIWPGFAINTVFYAAILWMLFAAPFALRRRLRGGRIKRGLCPACGYQVGASAVCTECGKPVKSTACTT